MSTVMVKSKFFKFGFPCGALKGIVRYVYDTKRQ